MQYNGKYKKTYNIKTSTTNWMVTGDRMLMKFDNKQERKK